MMSGVRENIAPYPEPISVETSQNLEAWFCIRPDARRIWPRERRRAVIIRNVIREMVKRRVV